MQPVYLIAIFAASAMAAPVAKPASYDVVSAPGSYFVTISPHEEVEQPQQEEPAEIVEEQLRARGTKSSVTIKTVTTETHTFRSGTDDESILIMTTTNERIIKPENPLSSIRQLAQQQQQEQKQVISKKKDTERCYWIFCGISRRLLGNPLRTQEIIAEEDLLY